MPRKNMRGGTRHSKKRAQGDQHLAAQAALVPLRDTITVSADYSRRPPTNVFNQHPPKNISNRITWIEYDTDIRSQAVSGTSDVEFNYTFQLNDNTNLSGLLSYFDQYAIYCVFISYAIPFSSGSSVIFGSTLGRLTTAIDYDNITNLGSEPAVQAYSSSQTWEMQPGKSVQRYIKPAFSTALYSGSAFNAYGLGRMFVDAATAGTPWYGIRSYVTHTSTAGFTIDVNMRYIVAFRNNI